MQLSIQQSQEQLKEHIDMARSEKNLTAVFTDTASAIRAKTGTTEAICPLDFADKINAIETGGGGMKAYFEAGGKCAYTYNIKSFDELINYSDTSNVTNFENMFVQCTSLQAIPNIDFSKGESFRNAFSNCVSLKSVDVTWPKAKSLIYTFQYCGNINSAKLNCQASGNISMERCFYSAQKIKTADINSPNVYDFSSCFSNCGLLESASIVELNKLAGHNVYYDYTFASCHKLYNATIDIGPVKEESELYITMNYCFYKTGDTTDSRNLNINFLNADKNIIRRMRYAFSESWSIYEIPAVNCAKTTGLDTAFINCHNLRKLHFYNISDTIDISTCTAFEREGLLEVLNNLSVVTTTKTCTLGSTNLAKLTDEDKAIATNKGWTLA